MICEMYDVILEPADWSRNSWAPCCASETVRSCAVVEPTSADPATSAVPTAAGRKAAALVAVQIVSAVPAFEHAVVVAVVVAVVGK